MTRIVKSALLVAALSAPLVAGYVPAAAAAESATAQTATTLLTVKSDRGTHSPRAAMILARMAAESGS